MRWKGWYAVKADIVTLAQTLASVDTDTARLNDFYDEALIALGDSEVIVGTHFIQVVAGTAEYALPAASLVVLAAFYNDVELTRAEVHQLVSCSRSWTSDTGTPTSFILMHEEQRTIRLYPEPVVTGDAIGGADFGSNYPANDLVLFTVDTTDAVPNWLDLALAMGILSREFGRQSASRDPVAAAAATTLGQVIRRTAGTP